MDWIDEKLFRLLKKYNSLRGTLFIYLLLAIIMTAVASMVTISVIVSWEKLLLENDMYFDKWFEFLTWQPITSTIPTEKIAFQINLLELLRTICPFIYGTIAVMVVTEKFYKKKIQEPLSFLGYHIQNMQEGTFDQPVELLTNDDFEQLGKQFDVLRQTLAIQQNEIIQLHTEQKKINAAFSHDIRTPLAIIQNNAELIEEIIDVKTNPLLEKSLNKIQNNVERLTAFSSTMQEIQKLEELPINKKKTEGQNLLKLLKNSVEAFPKVLFKSALSESSVLLLDRRVILEALENVLNNAERYAIQTINVEVSLVSSYLNIIVKDDGPGFSKEALRLASDPYFSQNKESHFGLGLTICEVLTQKHGGVLKLGNGANGGAIVTLVFKV